MYRKIRICLLAVCLLCACGVLARPAKDASQKPFTIVLDPGHGGRDYGCSGKLTNEKTIVLDVAAKLGEILKKEHPEINLVYTRDTDRYLTLQQRADVANDARGDLFVSIHVNSVDRRARNRSSVHGASVYTLGLHKSDSNLGVAMRENAVMELEQDYTAKYQGFDPNSSESYIMFELNQNSHVSNSIELASQMQTELVSTAGRADKNVRQAGFWVLWAVAMPSVLVELDFICNPEAERFLNSDAGRSKCARALANAVNAYYRHHRPEGKSAGQQLAQEQPKIEEARTEAQPDVKPTYHIQILTSPRLLDPDDERLRGVEDIGYYREGKLYKYYSGTYPTLAKARKHLGRVRRVHGEAFIIKLAGDKRI